jgi:hypothetical protein
VGLQLYDLLTEIQQLITATSLDRHCEHVQNSKSRTTRYPVMLKSLITDTFTVVVEREKGTIMRQNRSTAFGATCAREEEKINRDKQTYGECTFHARVESSNTHIGRKLMKLGVLVELGDAINLGKFKKGY